MLHIIYLGLVHVVVFVDVPTLQSAMNSLRLLCLILLQVASELLCIIVIINNPLLEAGIESY